MTNKWKLDSLEGKTLRWTFDDGPTAGKTYEHTFSKDGTILFKGMDGPAKGQSTRAKQSATEKVTDDIFVISYLGDSGYTLTVVLDFDRQRMVGFASNDKEWYQQHGTFEVVSDS
jgi:phenolic acid decarboxylase